MPEVIVLHSMGRAVWLRAMVVGIGVPHGCCQTLMRCFKARMPLARSLLCLHTLVNEHTAVAKQCVKIVCPNQLCKPNTYLQNMPRQSGVKMNLIYHLLESLSQVQHVCTPAVLVPALCIPTKL